MTRLITVLFACLLIAACGSSQEPDRPSDAAVLGALSGALDIPVFVSRGATGPVKIGTMTLSDETGGGKIYLQLPGSIGRCSGLYRTGGAPKQALFQVSCAGGEAAEGTFQRTGPDKGFGELRDENGRHVAFTFGET